MAANEIERGSTGVTNMRIVTLMAPIPIGIRVTAQGSPTPSTIGDWVTVRTEAGEEHHIQTFKVDWD